MNTTTNVVHKVHWEHAQFLHCYNVIGAAGTLSLNLGVIGGTKKPLLMYDLDLGFICCIHELRMKKSGRESQEYISAYCLFCSNKLFDCFLLEKSNMVNDVSE